MKLTNSIKLYLLSLILVVLPATQCFAEGADSTYITDYDENLTLKTFLYHNIFELNASIPGEVEDISYSSNNPINMGIGIIHPKIPFEVSFGYSIGIGRKKEYLRTKSFDFQIHKYGRKYVADVFIQDYKGFYIEGAQLTNADANFPKLSAFEIGVVGQYIFNGKKFSYQAAFNQNEKQLKSAGSFLVGAGAYYIDINPHDAYILSDNRKIKSTQIGFNVGYSYNWVINKTWLLNGSFTMGVNLRNENIKTYFNKQLGVSPMSLSRISTVYNKKHWAITASMVVNMVELTDSKTLKSDLYFGRYTISYTRRFNLRRNNGN